jgi:outer membrane receptor protein involved in Fe transport
MEANAQKHRFFRAIEEAAENRPHTEIVSLLNQIGISAARLATRASIVAALVIFAAGCPALAQKDAGAIVGTVTDSSGAVVIGATVTVTETERGEQLATTTNEQGEYVFSPLRIGKYKVAIEKAGFKKAEAGPLNLYVQDRLAVNIVLQPGVVTETVQVNAQAVELQTESSDLGQVVDSKRIVTLPLNGRNYAQLAQLGAGVAPSEPGSRVSSSYGFSANGARALQNNFLLDGVDNNANLGDVLNESSFVIQPSVDAIEEFKVQTNSYSAEFGRGNGAILNAVIKSGTNQFHGDVYAFLRNDALDAANSTLKSQGFGREAYKQNQFGATFGGPIWKNRTFFFIDYEGLRIHQGTILNGTIPTQDMIGGNFSSFLTDTPAGAADANGNPTGQTALDCNGNPTFVGEIFNARLTKASALNPNGFCGVPITGPGGQLNVFGGNTQIDSLAATLSALYPAPNANGNGYNYLAVPLEQTQRDNFDVRIDHKFTDADSSFYRFSFEEQPRSIPAPFGNALDGGGFFSGDEKNSYRSLAIGETHVLSPFSVNEFRFGYNRINSHRFQQNADTDVASQLGFPGVPFSPDNGGLPSISFSDGSSIPIGSSGFLPSIEKQNSFVFTNNFNKAIGAHTVRFGGEVRLEQFTIFQPSQSRGAMGFGTEFTSNPAAIASDGVGNAFATFLLGIPDSGSIVNLHNIDYRRQIYAVYLQDDWKVSSRLTLNLGLRYEIFSTVKEHHNQQATFDFATDSLLVPKGVSAQLTPTLAASIPVNATASRGLISPDLNNFAPRLGVAYKFTNRLVLRAGYGIFYGGQENGPFSNPSPGFNPPFFVTQSFNMPCGQGIANPAVVDCSIPGLNQLSQGFPSNALVDPNTPILYSLSPSLRTPYNQQWHLGFQYELAPNTVLDISYGGSRGLKLFTFYNGNQAVPATASQFASLCNNPGAGITPFDCPTAPRRPANICDSSNPPNCDSTFDTSIATFRSDGFSNYDSLQVRLERQFSGGLQFQASYTYGHALDNASSASLGSANQGDFRLQTNPTAEYGNADFDVRHRFVFSSIYELPFGKGKTIASGASGLKNQLVGGWQVAAIVTASTGNWYTPTDISANVSTSDCGGTVAISCIRPNLVGNPSATPCLAGSLFNTCAFVSDTVIGTFGNAGRNIIRGPGFQNWDLSLFKAFPLREAMRFEFRAEFFNAFNHANPEFTNPDTIAENTATELGSSSFGFPAYTRPPRQIQFGLKFYF